MVYKAVIGVKLWSMEIEDKRPKISFTD